MVHRWGRPCCRAPERSANYGLGRLAHQRGGKDLNALAANCALPGNRRTAAQSTSPAKALPRIMFFVSNTSLACLAISLGSNSLWSTSNTTTSAAASSSAVKSTSGNSVR